MKTRRGVENIQMRKENQPTNKQMKEKER